MSRQRYVGSDRILLRALMREWHHLNQQLLWNALRPPVLGISDSLRQLGVWDHRSRTITMSRYLLQDCQWARVREVLAHEMAHQYAHEVLGALDETAHGQAFRFTCKRMGISAHARGIPHGMEQQGQEPGGQDVNSRIMRKIQKLLALARSPNEHEARLAAARAQRLMLEYNLEQCDMADPRSYHARQLGPVKGRFQAHEKILAGLLTRFFFVEGIWLQGFNTERGITGLYLEIVGTRENLDMAQWVYDFLLETGERLWGEHKRRRGIRGNAHRRRYLAGVMLGFQEQLQDQSGKNREEGLIWVGDPGLQDFFQQRHPRTLRHRGPTIRVTEAWRDGMEAGRKIVLHRPVGAKPTSNGKLLMD